MTVQHITDLADSIARGELDADRRTFAARVRLDVPMAELQGRPDGAPSRVHLGVLWDADGGGDTAEYEFLYQRGQRRAAVGGSGRMAILVGHEERVVVTDADRDLYAWVCSCGLGDGPDYLHREYARDAWREAHGLAPLVNRPLV